MGGGWIRIEREGGEAPRENIHRIHMIINILNTLYTKYTARIYPKDTLNLRLCLK